MTKDKIELFDIECHKCFSFEVEIEFIEPYVITLTCTECGNSEGFNP